VGQFLLHRFGIDKLVFSSETDNQSHRLCRNGDLLQGRSAEVNMYSDSRPAGDQKYGCRVGNIAGGQR
jgi:hypothetical protein